MIKHLVLLLLASLMAACTPAIDGLVHDKSLSKQSLQQGGIAIAGLSSKEGALSASHTDSYSEQLKQALQNELKGLRIIPENELIYAMKREEHALVIDEFSRRSSLSAANINRLKAGLKVRYVAMARIDSNTISNKRSNQLESVDRYGKIIRPASTISETTRTIYTRLYLFDLHSGKRVWGGSIHLSRSRSRSYEHNNAAVNLIRGISALSSGMDSAYPYPQAPEEGDLLGSIFTGFAENLAKLK